VYYCFVVTTINVPHLLEGYARKLAKNNKIGFIVVGDKKTPHKKVLRFMKHLKNFDCESEYMNLEVQQKFLRKFNGLSKIFTYNSLQRRNIGFLKAAEYDAKVIITLDDDNYIVNEKYLNYHSHLGKTVNLREIKSSIGWFNPCSILRTNHKREIYMRGYPYSKRYIENKIIQKKGRGRVVLNMGLWKNDPDADAVTNLANPTKIVGLKPGYSNIMIGKGTTIPINTQNTAFLSEILPCCYDVIQGYSFKGLRIDRYDDIWGGFLAKKTIDHMGDKVTIGQPITNHMRNNHNLLNDLKMELWGMILTEKFANWLDTIDPNGASYSEIYYSLAKNIQKKFAPSFDDYSIRKYFEKLSNAMELWVNACNTI